MALVGLVLIVAGIVALIYRGIPYTTAGDGGGHRAHSCHRRARPDAAVPTAVGALAIVGGVALVVAGGRKSMRA